MRTALVIAVIVRTAVGVVAAILAPLVWRDHALMVVLMRPTKEVLLAAGFFVRSGRLNPIAVFLVALPLLLGGVWLFYALGKGWQDSDNKISTDTRAGKALARLLPEDRLDKITDTLGARGAPLVFLGRLAAFPSSLVAAAAGRSGMPTWKFLVADTAGALLSIIQIVGAGWFLGETYKQAGPWITAVGVAVLVAAAVLLGRWLQRGAGTKPKG